MQMRGNLHRYRVSPSRNFFLLLLGRLVPTYIAVLKIAGAHCFLALINSTIILKFGSIARIIRRLVCCFSRSIFLQSDDLSCDHSTCPIIFLMNLII